MSLGWVTIGSVASFASTGSATQGEQASYKTEAPHVHNCNWHPPSKPPTLCILPLSLSLFNLKNSGSQCEIFIHRYHCISFSLMTYPLLIFSTSALLVPLLATPHFFSPEYETYLTTPSFKLLSCLVSTSLRRAEGIMNSWVSGWVNE